LSLAPARPVATSAAGFRVFGVILQCSRFLPVALRRIFGYHYGLADSVLWVLIQANIHSLSLLFINSGVFCFLYFISTLLSVRSASHNNLANTLKTCCPDSG